MVPTIHRYRPALVRSHFERLITQRYRLASSFQSYPADNQSNSDAWRTAMQTLSPGDAVLIFTPDDLHHKMAHAAAEAADHAGRAHQLAHTGALGSAFAVSRPEEVCSNGASDR